MCDASHRDPEPGGPDGPDAPSGGRSGWRVSTPAYPDRVRTQRQVVDYALQRRALLAEVHYATADPWSGRLWFVNFEFDYSLTIDTTTN